MHTFLSSLLLSVSQPIMLHKQNFINAYLVIRVVVFSLNLLYGKLIDAHKLVLNINAHKLVEDCVDYLCELSHAPLTCARVNSRTLAGGQS